MTVIDRISFSFRMADEQFARDLYADWYGFCRRCVTDVMEDFFSPYDTKDSYIEIDSLDLDLGGIPQEDFMDEFPARLREALERNFIPLVRGITAGESSARQYLEGASSHQAVPSAAAAEKRFENFLHYLEYGFCLPEWSGCDFDPVKESDFFKGRDYAGRIAALIVSRPHAAVRLSMHTGDSDFGMDILRAVISSDAIGEYEKRRHIAATLEYSPQMVIRFIHETGESGILDGMAGLIGNPQVRRIMAAETEHHAEIGLPEYWYRLYGWLLEYYPFNGVPMFGDKRHFRLHLNRSLLSFIHKRTYASYISKAELTVQFLREVFGADHCLTVLDIIYRRQRLNPDGTPESGDSYAWELYYMLLRLSLIGPAQQGTEQHKGKDDGAVSCVSAEPLAVLTDRTGPFSTWLEDADIPLSAKRDLLERLARENPESLLHWIKGRPDKRHLRLLASLLAGTPALTWLSGSVSLLLAETVSSLVDRLDRLQAGVSWLKGTGRETMETAFSLSVLSVIADNAFSVSDSVSGQLLRIAEGLYREVTGMEVAPDSDGKTVSGQLLEFVGVLSSAGMVTDDRAQTYNIQDIPDKASENGYGISSLRELLSGNHVPEAAKRRILLQWFDTYRDDEARFLSALDAGHLLESVVRILGGTMLRQTVMRLAADRTGTYGTEEDGTPVLLLDWLTDNMAGIAEILSRTETGLWISLLRWMADSKAIRNAVSDNVAMDAASLLLHALNDGREITTDRLDRLAAVTLHRSHSRTGAEGNAVPAFLSHIRKQANSARWTDMDDALLAGQLAWLMSPSVSDTAKSQRLRHYARWQPELLWRLMRQASVTAGPDSPDAPIPFRQWASWLGREALLETVSESSLSLAETLRQTMEALTARYGIGEAVLTETLAAFMAGHPAERTYCADASVIVREYIKTLNRIGAMPAMQIGGDAPATDSSGQESVQARTTKADNSLSATMDVQTPEEQVLVERLVKELEAVLHLEDTEMALKEAAQPEYIEIPNAGLCLLALWFSRLFDMLGLVETGEDGKKDFRDTDARIRAIFVLQRLVTDERREYKEQELAFNRILAACPFSVPLPRTLELTDAEVQTVESMLAGVKSNWDKLKNTSVRGFQHSFIERPGKLEQREDKWVLYVEERSYDILLDSLPWSYRRIRLPWLKKRIDVVWRDKEEFDFENYNDN